MNRFDILMERPLPPEEPKTLVMGQVVGTSKCSLCGRENCYHISPADCDSDRKTSSTMVEKSAPYKNGRTNR